MQDNDTYKIKQEIKMETNKYFGYSLFTSILGLLIIFPYQLFKHKINSPVLDLTIVVLVIAMVILHVIKYIRFKRNLHKLKGNLNDQTK